jgi:Kp4 protein
MKFIITATALLASMVASQATNEVESGNEFAAAALGINCRGSSISFQDMEQLHSYSLSLDPNRQYKSGEHITCVAHPVGGTCAFFQGISGTKPGSSVATYIQDLLDHKCFDHGSVPVTFPQSNSPSNGILTVNYVSNTGGCNVNC